MGGGRPYAWTRRRGIRRHTWDDLAAKFMDCAAQTRLDPGKAQRAFGLLRQLETCPDIAEVVALLH